MKLPDLPHGCNSFAAILTETGKCVAEIFETDRRIEHLNVEKYHLIPMSEYLEGLNR